MDLQDKYDELLDILTRPIDIERDGNKYILSEEFNKLYVKNNKNAGIRIRKFMQLIRKKAEDIRQDVQSYKAGI